jgi:hypothetical protein
MRGAYAGTCPGCREQAFMQVGKAYCSTCTLNGPKYNVIGMKTRKVGGGGRRGKKYSTQGVELSYSPNFGVVKRPPSRGGRRGGGGRRKSEFAARVDGGGLV